MEIAMRLMPLRLLCISHVHANAKAPTLIQIKGKIKPEEKIRHIANLDMSVFSQSLDLLLERALDSYEKVSRCPQDVQGRPTYHYSYH